MNKLKEIILNMGDKINSVITKLPDFTKIKTNAFNQNDDVQIIENAGTDKESVTLYNEWNYCEMCQAENITEAKKKSQN